MFGRKAQQSEFEREVRLEVEILTKLHGEEAARVAQEKAERPTNRTVRRKVLEEAARQLGRTPRPAPKSILGRLFG